MKSGLFVATGIAIGLTLAGVAGVLMLPSSAFTAHAGTGPQAGADSNNGPMVLGTGGCNDNRQDIAWVLFKDGKVTVEKGAIKVELDRYVLCCYQVAQGGRSFDIVDTREITYDVKHPHLPVGGHNAGYSPGAMRKAYAESLK